MDEIDAELYLQNLWKNTDLSVIDDESDDDRQFRKNEKIINFADTVLLDRLEGGDISLSVKDLIQVKDVAFKQNRIIQGKDIWDLPLIPSTINIQIINN